MCHKSKDDHKPHLLYDPVNVNDIDYEREEIWEYFNMNQTKSKIGMCPRGLPVYLEENGHKVEDVSNPSFSIHNKMYKNVKPKNLNGTSAQFAPPSNAL